MKVVILAGGLGTRLSELTKTTPKPMVKVGGYPIITHIMNHYLNYGFKDFILASSQSRTATFAFSGRSMLSFVTIATRCAICSKLLSSQSEYSVTK